MAPVICGWEFFPKWKGAVSGVIVAGFGFGSFIFGFISIAIANPDGEKPDHPVPGGKIFSPTSPVSSNAPKMIRINAAIWAGLLFISLFMMNKKKKAQVPHGILDTPSDSERKINRSDDPRLTQTSRRGQNNIEIYEPHLSEAFRDYRLYYIWVLILLSSSYPYFIAANFKTYEEIDLHDDRFITLVGSLGAVTNGLSRGVWATLQDLFGFKIVFM
mmetsp:Transcript_21833/g.21568  ORF Transcript_21833/g.21568 Transcript_21833/m.21568 type:complete len:216 (+) Transcript_21833:370-1017(+)|eukprot:CAMPEP_0197001182 /NCGR_PEP_ID=MMETSP1380-20130617/5928_1 /TAXON_ID=5936 /ORGANISM="Euplotes crassus, Strain CT5" /LENGTH=215 /DNA_ID=CAMNT_0042418737 /DNA_START=130 /DNA_END=777 /DNA_ORIENTATION=-